MQRPEAVTTPRWNAWRGLLYGVHATNAKDATFSNEQCHHSRRQQSIADATGERAVMTGATLLALYKKPLDAATFDAYYHNHHAPLAKTLPGLQAYTLGRGGADDPYYLVAMLTFASMDALEAAVGSAIGVATVADLKNFAQAGVEILTFANEPA